MDEDADSFATIEWIRLLATYAAIHVAIHGLSRLKCLFRSEHVDSHVPDMTTPARGGSSRDRQANGHAGMGTYDALKSQCVPKAPVHVRRTHSFGLDPEELAEHVVYTVDHAVPLPGRRLETSDSDTEGEDQGDVCGVALKASLKVALKASLKVASGTRRREDTSARCTGLETSRRGACGIN
jgi:hypothetical protein